MGQKERIAGERTIRVQKEIAGAIMQYCEDHGISQQSFGVRLGFSAGTANHNIRNFDAMSPGFVLKVTDSSSYFKKYKVKWFKAIAEDHGMAGEDILPNGAIETAEKEEKIRRALLELQGSLVQLINNL